MIGVLMARRSYDQYTSDQHEYSDNVQAIVRSNSQFIMVADHMAQSIGYARPFARLSTIEIQDIQQTTVECKEICAGKNNGLAKRKVK